METDGGTGIFGYILVQEEVRGRLLYVNVFRESLISF